MPDIAKCNWTLCPLKDNCFRYTSMPNKYQQSYLIDTPFDTIVPDKVWEHIKYKCDFKIDND